MFTIIATWCSVWIPPSVQRRFWRADRNVRRPHDIYGGRAICRAGTDRRVHIAGTGRGVGDGRSGAEYITNVSGRGYCFVASVQRVTQDGSSSRASIDRVKTSSLPARLPRMVGRGETIDTLCSEVM